MKHFMKSRIGIFSIIFLFIGTCFSPLSSPQSVNQKPQVCSKLMNGQILFAPLLSTTTYLINADGTVNHTWPSNYIPGLAVIWLGNGTILRAIKISPGTNFGGGSGGGVQKIDWNGNVLWQYQYNTNENFSHHDIKMIPKGNVLMIAWETKTYDQAIAAGRNPAHVTTEGFAPDHIIEVKPTGPTTGSIVWEWHAWDHLIQDYNSSKANYGLVADHPELIDINYGNSTDPDWMHTNSIDYNEKLDQILISVRNFNETWIIDHSTTTQQAAGHSGGRYGRGGDLLYRWGNPKAYQRGTIKNQKLFWQHDATWIKPGYPGEGDILIFNNGVNRPDGEYSSIDEIVPPVGGSHGYNISPSHPYGPESTIWSYTAGPPTSFYANFISGAQRLKDGDTLICNGQEGVFFEINPEGAIQWAYKNPYPYPHCSNYVFKIVYIPPVEPPPPPPQKYTPNLQCEGNMNWTNIQPGETVYGSFQVENIGDPNSTLNWSINSYPDWGTWSFTPISGENLTPEEGAITVQVSVKAPDQKNTEFKGAIRVVNTGNESDYCILPVYLKTPLNQNLYFQHFFERMFQQFPYGFPFLRHLLRYL